MKWNFLIGYISLVQREGLSSGTTRMSSTTGSKTLLKGQIALSTGQIPGGGGTAIYGLYKYVPLWRLWFSSSLLLDGVYKSERLGLE